MSNNITGRPVRSNHDVRVESGRRQGSGEVAAESRLHVGIKYRAELTKRRMRSVCALLAAVVWLAAACGSRKESGESAASRVVERGPEAPSDSPGRIDERPVIVALGDSLTAGRGVDIEGSYPSQLQRRLDADGYRYRVVNAGISGDTSAQGLERLSAVRELRPAIVIVELGANDGLRGLPLETTRQNLDSIIGQLKADGADVILAGMELPPNYGSLYTGSFRKMFPDLARKHGIALIPFLLQGVAGRPDLNQEDGIHPDAQGYSIVVGNVWAVLRPMLSRNR
jgi:acyl-CoA thioesterase-1